MSFDGRGRYYRWDKRDLVTDYHRLSAHQVAKALNPALPGWYAWQWSRNGEQIASIYIEIDPGAGGVRLHYNYQQQPVEPYLIRWTTTTPHYGGQRYWWLCPICHQSCAHLYGGKLFACRRCQHLTYESAQTGDPRRERIERRLRAIRRRLGGDGGLWDPLPDKPRYMHFDTYLRLVWEYHKLETVFWGEFSLMAGLADEHPDLRDLTEEAWADYQRAPSDPPADLLRRMVASLPADDQPPPHRRQPTRRTLGQTAKAAEIPLAFAQEAQQEGLLRPDAGRTVRRKRYRPKVASWLAKLHTLRQAGYTWDDLRAWTRRRFLPEHAHERRWPAGYEPQTRTGPAECRACPTIAPAPTATGMSAATFAG